MQQSALNSLASSPYMVVSNSQVETGSKIQSEEPIQSNITRVASKLICATGKNYW